MLADSAAEVHRPEANIVFVTDGREATLPLTAEQSIPDSKPAVARNDGACICTCGRSSCFHSGASAWDRTRPAPARVLL